MSNPLPMALDFGPWLPSNISSAATTPHALSLVINILLVFAGARTSAYLSDLTLFHPFIATLNATLPSPQQGPYDSLTLTTTKCPFGNFVYRQGNPKFTLDCWDDYIIGRNLDFFAPGMIHEWGKQTRRLAFHVYETSTWTDITSEVVPRECILEDDRHALQLVETFMDDKVGRFDAAMVRMGLPYRFKWYESSAIDKGLNAVMTCDRPPDREWWERSMFHVALLMVGREAFEFRYLFLEYQRNWLAITALWNFTRIFPGAPSGTDLSTRVTAVFDSLKAQLEKGTSIEGSNLSLQLGKLASEISVMFPDRYSQRLMRWGMKSWWLLRSFIRRARLGGRTWSEDTREGNRLNCSLLEPGFRMGMGKRVKELVCEIGSSFPMR